MPYDILDIGTSILRRSRGIFVSFIFLALMGTMNGPVLAGGPAKATAIEERHPASVTGTIIIGDLVWRDINGNGLQDDGADVGIPNVALSLYRDDNDGVYEPGVDDVLISQSITDAEGYYQLLATVTGYYWIVVDESTVGGFQHTTGPQSVPTPELLWVSAGKTYTLIDFGYSATGYLWGTVFYDRDLDGMQGLQDDGVVGAEVCLYKDLNLDDTLDSGDPLLSCTQTDFQGNYRFTDLFMGSYLVQEVQQDGVGHTTPVVRAVDVDPWQAVATQVDAFADVLLASVSGHLYVDEDGNGVRDSYESLGVAFATVTATRQDTGDLFTTQSDADGAYTFTNLIPAVYEISAPSTLSGFVANSASTRTEVLQFGASVSDADFSYLLPTEVALANFTVSSDSRGNLIRWHTGSEQDLEGFIIWRSFQENGGYKIISPLIPASNFANGAEYQWLDTLVDTATTYWYKIESKPDGVLFGPVSVQPEPTAGGQTLFIPLVIR